MDESTLEMFWSLRASPLISALWDESFKQYMVEDIVRRMHLYVAALKSWRR